MQPALMLNKALEAIAQKRGGMRQRDSVIINGPGTAAVECIAHNAREWSGIEISVVGHQTLYVVGCYVANFVAVVLKCVDDILELKPRQQAELTD